MQYTLFLYPVLYLLIKKKIKKKSCFEFFYDVFRSLKGEKRGEYEIEEAERTWVRGMVFFSLAWMF